MGGKFLRFATGFISHISKKRITAACFLAQILHPLVFLTVTISSSKDLMPPNKEKLHCCVILSKNKRYSFPFIKNTLHPILKFLISHIVEKDIGDSSKQVITFLNRPTMPEEQQLLLLPSRSFLIMQ